MATRAFIPGQRWISNTESELGLGIVDRCDGRRVTLRFPAADEQRTYAADNAPLTRVLYPVGETVDTVGGQRLTVTRRIEHQKLARYTGVGEDGSTREFDEAELDSFARFSRPQDRLLAGQVDPVGHFVLRMQTLGHRRRHRQSPACGLLGGRVALLPHQLYIASEVAARHAPRVLLADEVGLGKTIEAGLVVHQQLLTGRATRALFVVPDSLLHQWLVEMLRRFNLRLTLLDAQRCEALESSGEDNPFESAQLVLCPLTLLAGDPRRMRDAVAAGWDLLVVDEAHHLQWSEHEPSPAYRAVEALARKVPGVLLLTATPEQLGAHGHFARLRLLDPQRYPDPLRFREEESGYRAVSALVERLRDGTRLAGPSAIVAELEGYLGSNIAEGLRRDLTGDDRQAAIDGVIRALVDRHGTGRVLFRNTRTVVGGFPPRKLVPQRVTRPAGEIVEEHPDALQCLLDPARALGRGWVRHDPRAAWLEEFLDVHRDARTLVICARADTARSLEEHLRLRAGLRTAVFHEDATLIARDRAAAYFAEPGSDGAQALICSEIGSEGRNFQHASQLVLFDLPLNPELLEQRIGRLDRIGQRQQVTIHVPYRENGPDHALLRWYHEGLDAFERPCAIGERMRVLFAERLERCLADPGNRTMLDSLVNDTRAAAGDMLYGLEQGRDRLLELSSCEPQRAAELVQAVFDTSRARELAHYMEDVFDLFGVEHQVHGAHSIVIQPGSHMICDSFPGLGEDGATATFQRDQALAREDMEFLSWEHPLVTGAMELILDTQLGNATFCTLNASLPAGTLVLEGVFLVHCPGPRALALHRYLSQDVVRHVVASDGRELTDDLSAAELNRRASPVPEDSARELLRQAWPHVEKLVDHAQRLAAGGQADRIDAAMRSAVQRQAAELERLRALAAVNPNVRAEEIDHLETHAEDVRRHLAGAQLRMDAVRVGIVT